MQTFIEKLKKALIRSCYDAFIFSDDETSLIDAEYLITVNTAKAISELNSTYNYKICLEHSTEKFSTSCPPFLKKIPKNPFGYKTIIRKGTLDTVRPGKIDIAVYKNDPIIGPPMCAIEVKEPLINNLSAI
jgi:hypothetical protein